MTLSNVPKVYRPSRGDRVPAAMIGSVYDGCDPLDDDCSCECHDGHGFYCWECDTPEGRADMLESAGYTPARRFGALIIPGRGPE